MAKKLSSIGEITVVSEIELSTPATATYGYVKQFIDRALMFVREMESVDRRALICYDRAEDVLYLASVPEEMK